MTNELEALEVIITGHKLRNGSVAIPEQPPWAIRDKPATDNQVFIPKTVLASTSPQQILSNTRARKRATLSVNYLGTAQTSSAQAQPAAGAAFTYTNTTGAPVSLVSYTATFTASAAVANRFPGYQISDANNNLIAAAVDGTAVVAGGVVNIRAYQGATQQNSGSGNVTFPLPTGIMIPVGGKLTLTGIADAGDQWSSIALTFGGISSTSGGSPVIFGKSEADLQNLITEASDNSLIGGSFILTPNTAVRVYGTTELWCVCLGPNFPYVSALPEVERTV